MRPNYAMDEPPAFIEVGGSPYPCNTDYRVWLDVIKDIQQLQKKMRQSGKEAAEELDDLFISMQEKIFGGVLKDENPLLVLKAVAEFSKGYPAAPFNGSGGERTYSFDYDLNEIIIAIRNQHGVDCSYRNKNVHWWEFLLYFHTLSGSHYILSLMETRGYKGKDREMIRRKYAFALPADDEEIDAELQEWSAQFAGPEETVDGKEFEDDQDRY